MMPSLSVVQTEPSWRRKLAPALSSPPKPSEPSNSPVDEPFETDRNFDQLAAQRSGDAIDDAAADQRLADAGLRAPARAVREQIPDRDGQVMIRIHQPGRRRDDAVPVGIGIVAEGDAESGP